MGFFLLQIFLPALAFAQDSSSFNDDDETDEVDGKPISVYLILIFVVLLGCLLLGCWLICTYKNNDDDSIISTTLHQYRQDTEAQSEGLQSWVSIGLRSYTVSSQRYNVIPISITLARGTFANAKPFYMYTV